MTDQEIMPSESRPHRKQEPTNPLLQGIEVALRALGYEAIAEAELPKRYTIYEPMLLLGATFSNHSSPWKALFDTLQPEAKNVLLESIAASFQKAGHNVTHIAQNAPISLKVEPIHRRQGSELEENITRSPINLKPLYGDFGSDRLMSTEFLDFEPTEKDFQNAFWVETSHMAGIRQVWAPRWTMFSRGNLREKSRIMSGTFPGLAEYELGIPIGQLDVVDFYVGIGYFTFSYLKKGARRVFGWDINAWSIEGLRRGCEQNGWSCLVLEAKGYPSAKRQFDVRDIVKQVVAHPMTRCFAFLGDNRYASEIMAAVESALFGSEDKLNVRHCNLGLLPSSRASWEGAVEALDLERGGWLHVHENTVIAAVEQKQKEVMLALTSLAGTNKGGQWHVSCEHTEMVKTYAPGVGHYVFDMKVWPKD